MEAVSPWDPFMAPQCSSQFPIVDVLLTRIILITKLVSIMQSEVGRTRAAGYSQSVYEERARFFRNPYIVF
jgi:hypothetical protein